MGRNNCDIFKMLTNIRIISVDNPRQQSAVKIDKEID